MIQQGDLLLLPMKVYINESSMADILSFAEVTNIAGVHIKINMSKGKVINMHIENRKIINFKAFAGDFFYTNLNDPTMITTPDNFSLNAYSYLYTVKQDSVFLLILKLKDRRKFKSYSTIINIWERHILRLAYDK